MSLCPRPHGHSSAAHFGCSRGPITASVRRGRSSGTSFGEENCETLVIRGRPNRRRRQRSTNRRITPRAARGTAPCRPGPTPRGHRSSDLHEGVAPTVLIARSWIRTSSSLGGSRRKGGKGGRAARPRPGILSRSCRRRRTDPDHRGRDIAFGREPLALVERKGLGAELGLVDAVPAEQARGPGQERR